MKDNAHRYLKFYTLLLLLLVLIAFILYQARILFIPLSFALLISFMYYPVGLQVEKRVGRSVSVLVCLLLLLTFGFLLFYLFSSSISLLQEKFEASGDKMEILGKNLLAYAGEVFGLNIEEQNVLMSRISETLLEQALPVVSQALSLSVSSLATLLIVPIFVSLVLYYRELLLRFVLLMVPEHQVGGFKATVSEMTITYFRFARGMGIVYLVVGILNSAGFLLLGLPHAIYLGILASLLTFFPYVGIMMGGAAAVVVAWTTYDSAWYPLGVVAVLATVQYLEANVIFPVAVGKQLRINEFATLVAIVLGGLIWGGAGMILFVPFAAILKILAGKIDGLQPLEVLLGPDSTRKKTPSA